MRPTFPLTLTLTLALGSTTQAQVYKWTDANGQVRYGSKPLPKAKRRKRSTSRAVGCA